MGKGNDIRKSAKPEAQAQPAPGAGPKAAQTEAAGAEAKAPAKATPKGKGTTEPTAAGADGGALAPGGYQFDVQQMFLHLAFAVAVGFATGLASVLLCIAVEAAYKLFQAVPWLLWGLPVMGVLQLLLYRAFKLPGDLTTHSVINRIRNHEGVSPFLAPGIFLTTCMSMVCGGSIGKEAGALQMGASLGSLIGRPFKLRSIYKRHAEEPMDGYAAATGMAACFSALFFAPIGATAFVIELSNLNRVTVRHGATIVIACIVAYLVSVAIGIGDVIPKVAIPALDWRVVGQVVVVGLAAALVGTVFDSAIKWAHDLTWRITRNLYVWVIVGGLAFAILVTACGWTGFTGSGGNTLNAALDGRFGPWDFAIKMLLTSICLSFWLKGGEIMPSLCIGGLLGASCTYLTGGDPALGAAIGCMSFFAAFSRCPFAAFFMGCEIFGWGMAPLMAIGVVIATLCGSPMGMYGNGIDIMLRTRWRSFSENMDKERHAGDDGEDGDFGVISKVDTVERALESTYESTDNKTPHPD